MDQAALDKLVADALDIAVKENGYDNLKEMAPSEVAVDLLDHDDGIYKFLHGHASVAGPLLVQEEVLSAIEKSVLAWRAKNP